jgi:uncharacterized protein (TIGR02118 family)
LTFAMLSVVILYPKSDDTHFDMEYYTSKHMPLFADVLGDACQGWGVMEPTAEYHAVAWAMVESMDAFGAAMGGRGGEVMSDVANYTNTQAKLIMGAITGTSG